MSQFKENQNVAVIGGIWGFAWADVAAEQGHKVKVFNRNYQDCSDFNLTHVYRRLPGHRLSENIKATTNRDEALDGADVLVLATRFQNLRGLIKDIQGWSPKKGVLNLSKGLELGTNFRAQQIVGEEHPEWLDIYGTWSGFNIASKIASGERAEAHIASTSHETAIFFEEYFGRGRVSLIPTPDVIGSEFGGGLKNVMVMAKAMMDCLGIDKIKGEDIMDLGEREMADIGEAYGASRETFKGPSGRDDFRGSVKHKSRNYLGGWRLGEGETASDLEFSGVTYEGLHTIKPAFALAKVACVKAQLTEIVNNTAYPQAKILPV